MLSDNILIVLIIIIACLLCSLCAPNKSTKSDLSTPIQIMVRQAARWSTAAKQDDNTMIAVLHANYGAGYLWALKDIASDSDIESAANIDMKRFTYEIVKIQDNATKKMAKLCPKYAPQGDYLANIGGEGG